MKRLIVLLGVLGVSASSVLVRLSTAPSLILVLYRVGFATLILAPWVWLRHRQEVKNLSAREVVTKSRGFRPFLQDRLINLPLLFA